jgi:hypothetical protein
MKHLDQIKLILFMIVKVMIYLWAKLLLMLEKVVQLYLLLFLEKCLMLIGLSIFADSILKEWIFTVSIFAYLIIYIIY